MKAIDKTHITNILDRLQPTETAVLITTSILVGAVTSLGAVLFIYLIEWLQNFFFVSMPNLIQGLGRGWFIIIPAIGGLIAGPIIAFFAREAKGHGVPEVMEAIAVRGGRIRPQVVIAKLATSAICIGTGGSAGREGPIVQVGAALGSTVGQWLNLSETRIRNLVACGAAAGIAATFNAPIAGVIFAMEIILGEMHLADMGNVIISAVTASVISQVILGAQPAFPVPNYGISSPWEVLLYVLLGVLAAGTAVFFIRLLDRFESIFDRWRFPDVLKPAVGGLLLGLLAFAYPLVLSLGILQPADVGLGEGAAEGLPHVFSSGFWVIENALLGRIPFLLLFALVLLKPLATSLTLGSGNSGGVFAPALFTGAALGGAFGKVLETVVPGMTAGSGAYAVVGMAAVFAGAARAPFTAFLIVFEMTDDYRLIVPLMASVIVSLLVAERLEPESIYTLKLSRRGIRLKRGRDVDVMESVHVEEVMVREPASVPANLPIAMLASEFLRTGRHGFPVLDENDQMLGVVSLIDYRRAIAKDPDATERLTVGEIATRTPVVVYPDETVGTAMRRMAPRDLSRLPVVARDDPLRLLGVVRRNDIVRAYEVGVIRREEARRRADKIPLIVGTKANFIDIPINAESSTIGKAIEELSLPRSAVLVSVRRGSELVIPHGDTRLQFGDVITALCERSCVDDLKEAINPSLEKRSKQVPDETESNA